MNPVKTESSNTNFVAEDCDDLPAAVFQYADGKKAIESCWQLSPEELAYIQRTGKIYLTVLGGQPPVNLAVKSVFDV